MDDTLTRELRVDATPDAHRLIYRLQHQVSGLATRDGETEDAATAGVLQE